MEPGEPSNRTPYSKIAEQGLTWSSKKWSLKKWKYLYPPPDEIAVTFQAMLSTDKHLCEECGHSTTTSGKEDDLIFVEIRHSLHFHKTCFLAVLHDNRGQYAVNTIFDHLGKLWRILEEQRLLQYLQQRNNNRDILLIKSQSDDESNVQSLGDTNPNLPIAIQNNSIELYAYQHTGDLLFTQLIIANLGNKRIEALLDTGATTSFIKKSPYSR